MAAFVHHHPHQNANVTEEPPGQLTVDSLGDLLEAVYQVSTKWYNLGLRLGLQPGLLDTISVRCQQDPEVCLREMLKEWLKRGEPTPEWKELVTALKSTAVGETTLARDLMLKYNLLDPFQQLVGTLNCTFLSGNILHLISGLQEPLTAGNEVHSDKECSPTKGIQNSMLM